MATAASSSTGPAALLTDADPLASEMSSRALRHHQGGGDPTHDRPNRPWESYRPPRRVQDDERTEETEVGAAAARETVRSDRMDGDPHSSVMSCGGGGGGDTASDEDCVDDDGVESSASTILHNNLSATAATAASATTMLLEWNGAAGGLPLMMESKLNTSGPAMLHEVGARRLSDGRVESTGIVEIAPSSDPSSSVVVEPRVESSSSSLSSLPLLSQLPPPPTRRHRGQQGGSNSGDTADDAPDLLIPKLTSESIESHLLRQPTSNDLGSAMHGGEMGGGGNGFAPAATEGPATSGSDVLSTASEMGTVIDAPHVARERIAQLDDVLGHYQQQQELEEPHDLQEVQPQEDEIQQRPKTVQSKTTRRPVTPKSRNTYYEHMFDIDDDENGSSKPHGGRDARGDDAGRGGTSRSARGLALPKLDGTYHFDEKKVSETVSSTAVHVGGSLAAAAREGLASGDAAAAAAMPSGSGSHSHLAAGILTRTMKRFSSNLLLPTSVSSAPNTPRPAHPRPPTSSSRKVPGVSASVMNDDEMPVRRQQKEARQYQSPMPSFASSADDTPTSFLLRSPGSSARMAAKRQHRQMLEEARANDLLLPRFGSWSQGRRQQVSDSDLPGSRTPPPTRPPPAVQPTSSSSRKYSHVLARACFSFDAYDTCVDHLYEVPAVLMDPVLDRPHNTYMGHGTHDPWLSSPIASLSSTARAGHVRYPAIPERSWESSASTPTPSSSYANHLQSLSPLRADADRAQPLFRTSSSWDAGSSTAAHSPLRTTWGRAAPGAAGHLPEPFAFRTTRSSPTRAAGRSDPTSRNHPVIHRHRPHFIGPLAEQGGGTHSGFVSSPPRAAISTPLRPSSLRNGFMSSPSQGALPTPSRGQPESLASPQRLEMEREDALDILACLVERGVTLKNATDDGDATKSAKAPATAPIQPVSSDKASRHAAEAINKTSTRSTGDRQQTSLDLAEVVESLVKISSQHGSDVREDKSESDLQPTPASGITHKERVRALEELLRSHEYALEMKRVSQSASSWLQSIGRNIGSTSSTSESPATTGTPFRVADNDLDEDELGDEEVDLLTAKAMLHSACVEIEERTQYAETLNVELAKCRAEIGRLKSAANTSMTASFRSPNRSILDVSEELSPTSSIDRSFDNASPIPGKEEGQYLDSSFEDIVPLRQDKTDLAKFQAALEDANEMIRKLHGDLKLQAQGKLRDGDIEEDAPVIVLSDVAIAVSPSTSKEELAVENDPENFVTDWDELRPALPPPPDHELRSPIVESVLEGWSPDPTLRERLLDWMDQVLSGADPISIPPLTLSHLDNQVRDGFTTHVLPLLLRRPDIRVDVQTRAQRLTTYDLAISVERVVLSQQLLSHRNAVDVRQHGARNDSNHSDAGTDFASHSTVTALVSNKHRHHPYQEPYPLTSTTSSRSAASFFPEDPAHPGGATTSRLSHDEMADGSVGPHHPHAGIMGALGDALGGLLSRRKGGNGAHDALTTPVSSSMPHVRGEHPDKYMITPRNHGVDAPSSAATEPAPAVYLEDVPDDDEPYHRVVAAPPGRLGVTFVEYRGHAMVSDVAEDKSPLTGWIFPGDILIAIDELSVSGMRLRDVIQVLKDRGNRQRALRVISSHDMTELTLGHNTSALMNDVS